MPIYDFECGCGYDGEHFAGMEEKKRCPKCESIMKRLISGKKSIDMGVGAYGYYDDNLQAFVGTNKEKRAIMKAQGVSEKYGKNWY